MRYMSKNLHKEELSRAKNYVYTLLARRIYTNKEIHDKLNKQGYPDEIIQAVISTMERYGYLNDRNFAEEWIRSRMRTKPKGRIALRRELTQRGVEESIIEEALSKAFDESKEGEAVLDVAKRRIKLYNNDDPVAIRRKLQNFLLRRGFDFETVRDAVEKVMKEDKVFDDRSRVANRFS